MPLKRPSGRATVRKGYPPRQDDDWRAGDPAGQRLTDRQPGLRIVAQLDEVSSVGDRDPTSAVLRRRIDDVAIGIGDAQQRQRRMPPGNALQPVFHFVTPMRDLLGVLFRNDL